MPNEYLDKVNLNGTTYDIKDTISGYLTDVKVNNTSVVTSGVANLVTNTAYNASTNKIATMSDVGAMGGGTVTSVGIIDGGGLSVSGSPVTGSGAITVGHANASITAQTTQALYPIKIDAYGHITAYGTAVTVPTVYDGALKLQKDSGTASSIYTANQSTATTVKFTTTSIGSASGWSAGTVPTLGTAISADDITSWTTNTPTAIDTTQFSGGSFTKGAFSGGSFTQGAFTAGSLSMSGGGTAASSASTLTITFTAPSHASDSFTAATHANDSFTAASILSGFYTAGSAASLSYSAKTIPNLTSVGTAPSLTVTSTTVVTDITKV